MITAIALLVLFPLHVPAAGPCITVTPAEATPGDTVAVSVTVSCNPGFMYLKLRYAFDSEKLDFVRAENGTVSTDSFSVVGNVLSWDTGTDATENGTLVRLIFSVKEKTVGTADIKLTVANCFNYDEKPIVFSVVNGAVTVNGGSARPFLKGDVDGDSRITAGDARLALRASVKLEHYAAGSPQFLAADVDNSGQIQASDARLILRASVNLVDLSEIGN